jgi:succinyl-CoA synthetase beta subunit
MDLFEYEGKQLFAAAGIPVPRSWLIHARGPDPSEIVDTLGFPLAVKTQVLTGGRGKAGGVRLVRSRDELARAVADLGAMTINGHRAVGVLLEEAVEIAAEYYLAITIDRGRRRPLLLFSTRGGTDIETLATSEPQAIWRQHIDPLEGLQEEQLRDLAVWAGLVDARRQGFVDLVRAVWQLFCAGDCTLVELNPLVLTRADGFLALDSKVTVDGNALFRHPELAGFEGEDDERARRAHDAGLTYVALDGDVGVIGNGAGLVMSALDLVAVAGGRPADFLDVGGGAPAARIAAALELVLADAAVRAVLVTIFGGITRCDEVARGLVEALRATGTTLPVVVRLDGNRADEGRAVLGAAGLGNVRAAATTWQAVQLAVGATGGGAPESGDPPLASSQAGGA